MKGRKGYPPKLFQAIMDLDAKKRLRLKKAGSRPLGDSRASTADRFGISKNLVSCVRAIVAAGNKQLIQDVLSGMQTIGGAYDELVSLRTGKGQAWKLEQQLKALRGPRLLLSHWMTGKVVHKAHEGARYGDGSLEELAKELKSSQQELRYMARFYSQYPEESHVATLQKKGIQWSHMRLLVRLDSATKRNKLIEETEKEKLTVNRLEVEVRRIAGKPEPKETDNKLAKRITAIAAHERQTQRLLKLAQYRQGIGVSNEAVRNCRSQANKCVKPAFVDPAVQSPHQKIRCCFCPAARTQLLWY